MVFGSLWPNMTCRWRHRAHGQPFCNCRDLFKASTITYRHALFGLVTSARVVDAEAQLRSRREALETSPSAQQGEQGKTERRSVLVNAGLPEPEGWIIRNMKLSKWIRNDLETLKMPIKSTIFWCEIIKIVEINSVKNRHRFIALF